MPGVLMKMMGVERQEKGDGIKQTELQMNVQRSAFLLLHHPGVTECVRSLAQQARVRYLKNIHYRAKWGKWD